MAINQTCYGIVARGSIDPVYLYYYLSNTYEEFRNIAHGSVFDTVTTSTLGPLDVALPPLHEQRAIAHILGTLDDKIELNRRINETLEAMARVIFKSWFVDFDPVIDNALKAGNPIPDSLAEKAARRKELIAIAEAEGRQAGLPPHLATLFPHGFVDSELGEIPERWTVSELGELIELAYGKGLKAGNRMPGDIPVMGSNGQIGWHDQSLTSGPGIVVGRKGNPGTITWVETDFFPIDTTFYVVPKGEITSLRFLFHALAVQDLPSLAADSAVPGLNRNLAYMSKQIVPNQFSIASFNDFVKDIAVKSYANEIESSVLAELRDALLPKLISGEIRVSDAEEFLARAGIGQRA
jgi:type I restriction enzyme S subunit